MFPCVHQFSDPRAAAEHMVETDDGVDVDGAIMRWRWPATFGVPYCPWCGSGEVYQYECRAIFKCKECRQQFSMTTKTNLDHCKLPLDKAFAVALELFEGTRPDHIARNLDTNRSNGEAIGLPTRNENASIIPFKEMP